MRGDMDRDDKLKVLEAFAYIAKNAPWNKKNEYNVLKVFYFADKLHMERYGRFIFNDWYAALEKGPVPSNAYDLLKKIRVSEELPDGLEATVKIVKHQVVPLREADEDEFSISDIECINEAISISKKADLGKLSHDEAWTQTPRNCRMDTNTILSTLSNSDSLIDLNRNRYA
jgi:uncharacterized phage-associated protein